MVSLESVIQTPNHSIDIDPDSHYQMVLYEIDPNSPINDPKYKIAVCRVTDRNYLKYLVEADSNGLQVNKIKDGTVLNTLKSEGRVGDGMMAKTGICWIGFIGNVDYLDPEGLFFGYQEHTSNRRCPFYLKSVSRERFEDTVIEISKFERLFLKEYRGSDSDNKNFKELIDLLNDEFSQIDRNNFISTTFALGL